MGENRVSRIVLHSHTIAGIMALLVLTISVSSVEAIVLNSCNSYCHGMPPRDGVRKGNPHFDSQSSAFSGNHRSHLPATSVVANCNACHTPVSPTDFGHQNGVINMANSLKGYSSASIRAKYDKGIFINQTSIPNMVTATCSNTSCHFEAKSPAWNASPLAYPAGCSVCHGVPPSGGATGTAGSHVRHDAYYTGATGCQKCHPAYTTFSHASSAGRPLRVQGYLRDPANNLEAAGTYSGSGTNYLPSQSSAQVFGTCSNLYCHSSGQGTAGTGTITYQSAAWGGAPLNCGSCHQNMATASAATGSHQLHATATTSVNGTGENYTCQVCHGLPYSRSRTPVGLGGLHVNKNIELAFTTISGGVGAGTTYSKSASFAPGAAYGQCSASACHGSGKPVWGANTTRPECFKCHGSTVAAFTTVSSASVAPGYNNEGRDTAGNIAAVSPRVGAHQTHLTASDNISSPIHCGECHTTHLTVKDATHLNFTTATITFGPLAKNANHSPVVSRTAGVISCSNIYCHTGNRAGATASSTTPVFASSTLIGNTSIADTCTAKCHGMPPGGGVAGDAHAGLAASGSYTTPASLSACSSQTGGTGCHPTIAAAPASMATIFADKTKHVDGIVDAAGGHAFPYPGATHMAAAVPITNCTGCHTNGNNTTYPVTAGIKPDCRACHGLASPGGGCITCHGISASDGRPSGNVFPNISGSHSKHVVGQGMACADCHFSYGTGTTSHGSGNRVAHNNVTFVGLSSPNGKFHATKTTTQATCNNIACHGNAIWGVTKFNCVSCHSVAIGITKGPLATNGNQRRAVATELMNTWSHARSMRLANGWGSIGQIPPSLCITCHMEGNPANGSQMASYHGNGYVELRDPDTGLTIQNVTWVSAAGAGNGFYTNTGTAMNTMAAFRRNLASATLEPEVQATQINFCLKCHDSNGALSTLARIGGSTASALQPYNVVVRDWVSTGLAMSSMGNRTNGSGNVVDVKASLMTSNASYHPVMGKGNNGFAKGLRMVAPWNSIPQAIGTNTQWGYLISCWDCHAPGAATGMQTFSVTAHGAPATLRGGFRERQTAGTIANNNFCFACHVGGGYGGGNNHAAATMGTSGYNSGGSSMTGHTPTCFKCHGTGIGVSSISVNGSSTLTTISVRPLRAQDVHGFNDRYANVPNSTWQSGNRPYAFIRNVLTSWTPAGSEAGTKATGNCNGIAGRTCDDNMNNSSYSPGGRY